MTEFTRLRCDWAEWVRFRRVSEFLGHEEVATP